MKEVAVNPRVGWRSTAEGIIAFNCEDQTIVRWDEIASAIWERIYSGETSEGIVSWISSEYEIPVNVARTDFLSFVQEAETLGMLKDENRKYEEALEFSTSEGEDILTSLEMLSIKTLTPFAVTFEATHTCNESCVHCYMDTSLPSLGTSDILSILRQLADAGCLFICFTGGEFFTRKDALEILRYASEQHFVIDVLSNATLITSEIAQFLASNPVRRVQVSLYGSTQETHDTITRLHGSFQRTLRGIRRLLEEGVKVEIVYPLMPQNYTEVRGAMAFAESIGCLFSPSPIITAKNDGDKSTHQLRISDEMMVDFLKDPKLSASYSGRKPFEEHKAYFDLKSLDDAPPCYSGYNTCSISPLGKVYPCNSFLMEMGDLTEDSFDHIWNSSSAAEYIRSIRIKHISGCSTCEQLPNCARCPGLALIEDGSILGPSSIACNVTNLRLSLQTEGR